MCNRATSVIVISHYVDEIEQRNDARELDVSYLRRTCRCGDGQLVVPSVGRSLRIQLVPQLGEKQREVLSIDWTLDVALQASLHRKLPIDIDPIEQTWPAPDEKIDCGARKALSRRFGQSGVGKPR